MGKLFFHHIVPSPQDPIFGLVAQFEADPNPQKVSLSAGVYHNEQLQTPILQAVKEAEALILREEKTKTYLPIAGDPIYISRLGALIFGEFFWQAEGKRICGFQTPGGTGALRVCGDFLKQEVGSRIMISDPTWPNHNAIFARVGMTIEHYRYYDHNRHQIDVERVFKTLRSATPGTVVLLQPCCHNPTGLDFTKDEWKTILGICKENGLLPFFDFAYQGLGRGIEADAEIIRLFAQEKIEMVVAYSTSKNFGLYSERAGALFVVTEEPKAAEAAASKIKTIIRTTYSNPPRHASAIVSSILSSTELRKKWEKELEEMRQRIDQLRHRFVEAFSHSSKRDFRFLLNGKGMFCFTGLKAEEVARLKNEFSIYLTSDGRMNIAGLCDKNFTYVVKAVNSL